MATNAQWIRHPGFYINEELEARGWLQRDLAFILGCPEQKINTIIAGKRSITPEMAKALGEAFDVNPELFANLQKSYDMAHARNPYEGVAQRRVMQDKYPVRAMIQRGWIQQTDVAMLATQLDRFFEVEAPGQIPNMVHAGKKSHYEGIPPAQLAWLFRARHIARSISVPEYSEKRLRSALTELEPLLLEPEQTRHVPRILMECGVRYILIEKLPTAGIDGVCFWLDKDSPVIGMSLQHDRIDNFWFVLRHEIEHVLQKHGQEQEMVDLDLDKSQSTGSQEEERVANDAAGNFCTPSERMESFVRRKQPFFYQKDVIAFARVLNRHPGIIVGQLRRRLNRYDYLTRYLYQFKIRPFVVPGAIADGWGQSVTVSL
jgi:HTH-type transcriptional regulator / antitoxin HigA